MKDLISQALLFTTPYDEFRNSYPSLHRLVAKEIDERRRIAKTLPVDSDNISHHRSMPCHPGYCPQTPFESAMAVLRSSSGLSIPALVDMTRNDRIIVRVHGLMTIEQLRAVMPLDAVAERQTDTAEFFVVTDTDSQAHQIRDWARLTPTFAIRYSFWHPASRIVSNDLAERRMNHAVRELCRHRMDYEQFRQLPPPAAVSSDAWNRPIRISGFRPGQDLVLWSTGANAKPGDGDDIIRYLKNCDSLPVDEEAPIAWTAAGGGATVVPPQEQSCKELTAH